MNDASPILQFSRAGGMVGVERRNSTESIGGFRPRQHGGFSLPLFRGLRAHVQPERVKARRLDLCRVSNPRSTSAVESARSGHAA